MIDKDRKIYRIVNFFDLYKMLNTNRLRVSKQKVFEDKNEGLGHIMSLQTFLMTRHGFRDEESIINAHKSALYSTYVSCWTMQKDSIALWSLYSKGQSSIRIRTTLGKLEKCIDSFHKNNDFNAYQESPSDNKIIAKYCELNEVEYVDFHELRADLEGKFKSFEDLIEKKSWNNKEYYTSKEFRTDFGEFNNGLTIHNPNFLKDEAYSHEKEIRGVIHCGVRSGRTVEEVQEDPFKSLVYAAGEDILPDYIYARTESDFIEEICFDPRTPSYQVDVYKEILREHDLDIATTKCFGYALLEEDFPINVQI